jgi:hypothetical protein
MRKILKLSCYSLLLVFLASSCKKDPGEGGNSAITGKVYIREYNKSFTTLTAEYFAPDEDIYIIYGDGTSSDDDLKTGPNGDFIFRYLRPGKYKLYAYSADSAGTTGSGTIPVYVEVEITKKNQTVDAGTIIILKN